MTTLRLTLAIGLLVAAAAAAPGFLARWMGAAPVPLNGPLESARIHALEQERTLAADLVLAGTSRTASNYDPTVLVEAIREQTGHGPTTAWNLGRVLPNRMVAFEASLSDRQLPTVLVLECSPHLFFQPERPEPATTTYGTWRKHVAAFEQRVSGIVRAALGLEDLLTLSHRSLKLIKQTFVDGRWTARQCFYGILSYSTSEHRVGNAGHVHFRAYLPDRSASDALRPLVRPRVLSDYAGTFASGVSEETVDAYLRLIARYEARDRYLFLVRPPVSADLYELENRSGADLLDRIRKRADAHGAAWIDLNPSDYASADLTHVDWFDTARLSRDLGRRLADHAPWSNLHANTPVESSLPSPATR